MSFSRNLVLYVICLLKGYLVHKSVCTCDTKVEGFGNQGKGGTQWLTVERVPSLPPPPASVTVCSLYFSLPWTYSKDRWTPAPYNVSPSSCWCWMKGMCTICQTPRRRQAASILSLPGASMHKPWGTVAAPAGWCASVGSVSNGLMTYRWPSSPCAFMSSISLQGLM